MEINESEFLASQIVKMFRLDVKPPALLKAERTGRIPIANRRKKGTAQFRYWGLSELPKIAKEFGHILPPLKTEVFCIYVPKGGVGKSFFTFNFARYLALHGIKVLVIGMDFQCTLSKNFGINYFNESKIPCSLFDCLAKEEVGFKDLIIRTEIPDLYLIPESPELNVLDNYLFAKQRREYLLAEELEKVKSAFDVVLIDCPPYWNQSVTNALMASNRIVSTINSDGESYHSFKVYMRELERFMAKMKIRFDSVKFIPNYVNLQNNYTTEFRDKLVSSFGPIFTSAFIRDSVSIKEAGSSRKSILEYKPSSNAADDTYKAIVEVWSDVKTRPRVKNGTKQKR